MENDYIKVPISLIEKLTFNDYVRYKKKADNTKWVYGFIGTHWRKDNVKGMSVKYNTTKGAKSWTVSYDYIEEIEKKVNPKFYFEFNYILNSIKT